jgi:hypothetical protein
MMRKDNPPAFPRNGANWSDFTVGMSLRDYFAGQALVGTGTWVPNMPNGGLTPKHMVAQVKAEWCYEIADAMLAARQVGDPS